MKVTLLRTRGNTETVVTMARDSLGQVTRTKDLYLAIAGLKAAAERKVSHDELCIMVGRVEAHVGAVEEGHNLAERKLREHLADVEGILEDQLGIAGGMLRRKEERIFRESRDKRMLEQARHPRAGVRCGGDACS